MFSTRPDNPAAKDKSLSTETLTAPHGTGRSG